MSSPRAWQEYAAGVFADLPRPTVAILVRAGYTTRSAIAEASDTRLLSVKGIGQGRLARIRAVIPARLALRAEPCAHCDGTGWVEYYQ